MSHLLVVNSNPTGLKTINKFLNSGHAVSYLECEDFREYSHNEESDEIKRRLSNFILVTDMDNTERLLEAVDTLNEKKRVDGVICVSEFSMEYAALIASHLKLPFPSVRSVADARDKQRTREILDKAGIRNVRYRYISGYTGLKEAAQYIGYPVVVKPQSSVHSTGTIIVQTHNELEDLWKEAQSAISKTSTKRKEQFQRGYLVEAYLRGTMVSAEVVNDGAESSVFMISGRIRSLKNELTEYRIDMPAELTTEQKKACESYALSVTDALQLKNGIFHIELIIDEEGPVLVEVNPRIMGSYMPMLYERLTGNDYSNWLASLHTGSGFKKPRFRDLTGELVASAVRFDAVNEAEFIPADFRAIVTRYFNPHYAELSESAAPVRLSSGETIGRIQVTEPSHASLQNKLERFFSEVYEKTGIVLLR